MATPPSATYVPRLDSVNGMTYVLVQSHTLPAVVQLFVAGAIVLIEAATSSQLLADGKQARGSVILIVPEVVVSAVNVRSALNVIVPDLVSPDSSNMPPGQSMKGVTRPHHDVIVQVPSNDPPHGGTWWQLPDPPSVLPAEPPQAARPPAIEINPTTTPTPERTVAIPPSRVDRGRHCNPRSS